MEIIKAALITAAGILAVFLIFAAIGWKRYKEHEFTKFNNQKKFNELAKVRKKYGGRRRFEKAPKA